MATTIDFTKIKRNTFNVILDDGNSTKLRVLTPSKALSQMLDEVYMPAFAEEPIADQYDTLYDVATAILNRNADGIEVKREDIEECLDDIVDVWTLLNAYRQFIFDALQEQSKN